MKRLIIAGLLLAFTDSAFSATMTLTGVDYYCSSSGCMTETRRSWAIDECNSKSNYHACFLAIDTVTGNTSRILACPAIYAGSRPYYFSHTSGSQHCFMDTDAEPPEPGLLDDVDRCVDAIMVTGGNGAWIEESGQFSCRLGPQDEPACSIADGSIGTGACMAPPKDDPDITKRCEEGYVYGEINNVGVCVQSAGSNYNGTSDPMTWGSAKEGEPKVIAETERTSTAQEANGDIVTTTTQETTTQTETVRTEPAPHKVTFRCEDGRLAADRSSCDSTKTCPSNHYLVYGACVPVPSEEITDVTEQTTKTVTRTNETTNETSTETSVSTTNRPGSSGGGGGGAAGPQKVEIGDGPCDPTAKNYLECVSGGGSSPKNTDNEGATVASVGQEFYTAVSDAPLVQAMRSIANMYPSDTGSCPAMTIDLSNVPLIGRAVSTNIHCELAEQIKPVLTVVMSALWIIIGFRIFASA